MGPLPNKFETDIQVMTMIWPKLSKPVSIGEFTALIKFLKILLLSVSIYFPASSAVSEISEKEIRELMGLEKFQEAYDKLLPEVLTNAFAMHAMSYYYENGLIVAKDPEEAANLLLSAAKLGHVPAMDILAQNSLDAGDFAAAMTWDKAAWEQGSDKAGMIAGSAYLLGSFGTTIDKEEGIKYLRKFLDNGDYLALGQLGFYYYQKAKDASSTKEKEIYLDKAMPLLKQAAEAGNEQSAYVLEKFYMDDGNLSEALLYGELALSHGPIYDSFSNRWINVATLLFLHDQDFYDPDRAFKIISDKSEDALPVENYIKIARKLLFDHVNPESAIAILDMLLAAQKDDPELLTKLHETETLYYLAEAYEQKENLTKAMLFNERGLKIFSDQREDNSNLWAGLINQRFVLIFYNIETQLGQEMLQEWLDAVLQENYLDRLDGKELNKILLNISKSYLFLGRPKEAFELGFEMSKDNKLDKKTEIETIILRANALSSLKVYPLALRLNREALYMSLDLDIIDEGLMDWILHNLGNTYLSLFEFERAKAALEGSLEYKREMKMSISQQAMVINNLSIAHRGLGEFDQALKLHKKYFRLVELEKDLATFDLFEYYYQVATTFWEQGLSEQANLNFRLMLSVFLELQVFQATSQVYGTDKQNMSMHLTTEQALFDLFRSEFLDTFATQDEQPLNNLFLAVQSISSSQLGSNFHQAVLASEDQELAKMSRQLEGLVAQRVAAKKEIFSNLAKNGDKILLNKKQVESYDLMEKTSQLKQEIVSKFPRYSELVNPQPLSIPAAQTILGSDEGLFAFASDDMTAATYAFLITKEDARAYKIDLSETEISVMVGTLRSGIDISNSLDIDSLPSFDMELSYKLYTKLFGPVEDMLGDVKHLLVVPSGPIESLPLNLLVTEKPTMDPTVSIFTNYQAASWLPKKYSLTRLPTVSSLNALRTYASEIQSKDPFIGFGDPVLGGAPDTLRGIRLRGCPR